MNKILTLTLSLLTGLAISSQRVQATDIDWFDFTGWNHALIAGSGQTFNDVIGTVDLTVTASGSFTIDSKAKGLNNEVIVSGHATPGTNTFNFTLSEPLPIVINYQTVDLMEMLTINSPGIMTNTSIYGGMPLVVLNPGSLQLRGTGLGVGPAGASRGLVEISPVSSFTVTHVGLSNDKYEAFRIGTPVPEPTGLAWGVLGLLAATRLRSARRGG